MTAKGNIIPVAGRKTRSDRQDPMDHVMMVVSGCPSCRALATVIFVIVYCGDNNITDVQPGGIDRFTSTFWKDQLNIRHVPLQCPANSRNAEMGHSGNHAVRIIVHGD